MLQPLLCSALGSEIGSHLSDLSIIEILANPDGQVWVETLTGRCAPIDLVLSDVSRRTIIELVAASVNGTAHSGSPLVSAELPCSGHRFQGVLPPVVEAPVFSIRRRASLDVSLSDYVASGAISGEAAEILGESLRSRRNILIAGATGSGKTTLTNALLKCLADTGDRLLVLEDTRELQVPGGDAVALRTTEQIGMPELLRTALRLRPDRIVVGEVRGGEALTLIKSWNTGHPGGVSTLHADSAALALTRLEQLITEAIPVVPRAAIAEAVHLIAVMARIVVDGETQRRLVELVSVEGLTDAGEYRLVPQLSPDGVSRSPSISTLPSSLPVLPAA